MIRSTNRYKRPSDQTGQMAGRGQMTFTLVPDSALRLVSPDSSFHAEQTKAHSITVSCFVVQRYWGSVVVLLSVAIVQDLTDLCVTHLLPRYELVDEMMGL